MKINSLAVNQTQVTLTNGSIVLFSYETPVAAFIPGRGYLKTAEKWSNTTTKHVNKWIGDGCGVESQEFFNNLVK